MSENGFLFRFRDGQTYMDAWPERKELAPIFPEQRVIKATKFAVKVMPAVAVISVLTQMAFNNAAGLPQAIIIALFALSMPLQGFWWLGNRANTKLPPALINWYRELYQKIIGSGTALEPIKQRPCYKDLANVLNKAFKLLDRSELERWF